MSAPPALGQDQKDPTHTSNFGVKLQEHCAAIGVACERVYPGGPNVKHATHDRLSHRDPERSVDLLQAGLELG